MQSGGTATVLVTGGAGFIGSHYAEIVAAKGRQVVVLDALTYAGSCDNLAEAAKSPGYAFVHGSINDGPRVAALLAEHRPAAVVNFAAETHVDRSIDRPAEFIATNLAGTHVLLEALLAYWKRLPAAERGRFRLVQVSTDEVYGSVDEGQAVEGDPYRPNSPYAASKAGGDHLVRAYGVTYGLPVLVTHGSNTYGPRQYPEKLIPVMIFSALRDDPLPIYGDGGNVRDWLFAADHARAVDAVLERGAPGEAYNISAEHPLTNLALVEALCTELDAVRPREDGRPHFKRVAFVPDRPGHDRRYAGSSDKLRESLQWKQQTGFAEGLATTVRWYLEHEGRWRNLRGRDRAIERMALGRV